MTKQKPNHSHFLSIAEISSKYKLCESMLKKNLANIERKVIKGKVHYDIYDPAIKPILKFGQMGFITKTTVIKDFKLKEKDLVKMYKKEVKNPHYACAKPMQLYFEKQVRLYLVKQQQSIQTKINN